MEIPVNPWSAVCLAHKRADYIVMNNSLFFRISIHTHGVYIVEGGAFEGVFIARRIALPMPR